MRVIVLFVVLSLIAGAGYADAPPAYDNGTQLFAAGWGNCPIDWQTMSGSYDSGLCLYSGGNFYQWYDDPMNPGTWISSVINYAPISLDLWIELSMICTYQYTDYDWHRVNAGTGDETIYFSITGTCRSNETLQVSLDKLNDDLTHLWGQTAIVGSVGNIPITWDCRAGNGLVIGQDVTHNYQVVDPGTGNLVLPWYLPPCNHWFEFRGCFYLPEHLADGHYQLIMAGCPVPAV
jgi:hypothetical protein